MNLKNNSVLATSGSREAEEFSSVVAVVKKRLVETVIN
jgi:hypothetical protein